MKLLIGLGNPGKQYEKTLHNAGFMAVDQLAVEISVTQWKTQFKSLVTSGSYKGSRFVLLKPQTFMNVSGEAVLRCKQFYKLELDDILVLSDDIDRPVGSLRYRKSGGHGGHNGLRNIIQLCGGNDFHRIKIGVGRPDGRKAVSDHVLSKPDPITTAEMQDAIKASETYLIDFIEGRNIQIHQ